MSETPQGTYLERAFDDGHAELIGEGNLLFKREGGIVEDVLYNYEDRLAEFFDDAV